METRNASPAIPTLFSRRTIPSAHRALLAAAVIASTTFSALSQSCPLVKDINTTGNPKSSGPIGEYVGPGNSRTHGFVQCGSSWFFKATDDAGEALWKTDGTAAGTSKVADIHPGAVGGTIDQMRCVNGQLFFTGNNGTNGFELWVSDGTTTGTRLVKDIAPGAQGSGPAFFAELEYWMGILGI